jgi:hypothetical protein
MTRLTRACVAAALLVLLAIPGAGLADSGFYITIGTGGAGGSNSVSSNIRVTGAVTIDFHGDAAAGCAAAHVCDLHGTVRWDPSGDGSIFAIGYTAHGHRFEQGFVSIGDIGSEDRPLRTSARVRRGGAPGSLCSDGATVDTFGGSGTALRGSSVVVRMLDLPSPSSAAPDVLRTSCAGPMATDVAALLPARRITERALVRGHRTLDFSADKPFASHGLAGTLHSTVVARVLGGQRFASERGSGRAPSVRTRRLRAVAVRYRVERVSGRVTTGISGRGDPDLCGPLDACGITGSVTTAPAASSGTAYLTASGLHGRTTRRQLHAALGLARGRVARSVAREGYVSWDRDLGSITSDLSRLGTPACSDTQPLAGGGSVNLGFVGGRVRATYDSGSLVGTDRLRTRCPGPGSDDTRGTLAAGTFPLRIFRHAHVTLRLTGGRRFASTAYTGHSTPDVTVVLRRTRIRDYSYREEVPSDYPEDFVRPLH